MTIKIHNIPSVLSPRLQIKRDTLINASSKRLFNTLPDFESVIKDKLSDSKIVAYHFGHDFKFFNRLLFEIHNNRKTIITKKERNNLLQFLTIGYLVSNDIRYFNEFLWFYKKSSCSDFKCLVYNNFKKYLNENNNHSIPFLSKEEIACSISYIQENNKKLKTAVSFKIGLLGIPFVIKTTYAKLESVGHSVSVFLIPYFKEILRRLFLKSGIILKMFSKFKGVKFPYVVLNYNTKDNKINEILLKMNFDIGVFKLGFIAKENIYNAFKIGLLHDHLAILPFIRGRSSIEFSILCDVPVGATVHYIKKGIDSGSIINVYTYTINKNSTIKSIRKEIKSDFSNRITDSIQRISSNPNIQMHNDVSKGLNYYSMHPLLVKFIERSILRG